MRRLLLLALAVLLSGFTPVPECSEHPEDPCKCKKQFACYRASTNDRFSTADGYTFTTTRYIYDKKNKQLFRELAKTGAGDTKQTLHCTLQGGHKLLTFEVPKNPSDPSYLAYVEFEGEKQGSVLPFVLERIAHQVDEYVLDGRQCPVRQPDLRPVDVEAKHFIVYLLQDAQYAAWDVKGAAGQALSVEDWLAAECPKDRRNPCGCGKFACVNAASEYDHIAMPDAAYVVKKYVLHKKTGRLLREIHMGDDKAKPLWCPIFSKNASELIRVSSSQNQNLLYFQLTDPNTKRRSLLAFQKASPAFDPSKHVIENGCPVGKTEVSGSRFPADLGINTMVNGLVDAQLVNPNAHDTRMPGAGPRLSLLTLDRNKVFLAWDEEGNIREGRPHINSFWINSQCGSKTNVLAVLQEGLAVFHLLCGNQRGIVNASAALNNEFMSMLELTNTLCQPGSPAFRPTSRGCL